MNPNCRILPSFPAAAFTLVEIVLALGVASVFLIGIVSLLVTGLDSSQAAGNDTRLSLIFRDVANRVRGAQFVADQSTLVIPEVFYDAEGIVWDPNPPPAGAPPRPHPFYGVRTRALDIDPSLKPAHSSLLAIQVEVFWPVAETSGGPQISGTAKMHFSFYCASAAGNGWRSLDSTFVPVIEL